MRRLILSILCLLPLSAAAQNPQVPQSEEQIRLSYAPVVRKAAPAVVNIYTKTRVQVREQLVSPLMNDPFFQQFFGRHFALPGRTREQVASSLGSGVIVSPEGMVVTSNHVVKDAESITVVLSDKREFEAEIKTRDPQSDLAFLKIKADAPLPFLEMRNSDTLEVGDLVLAIGNPFGVGQTVTSGIISALAREARGVSDYQFFIQTDAAINPGNSGGALVDMDGRLIGINTAIYSASGGSLGIGFAIPSNMVRAVMGSGSGGRIVRPWMGVAVQPVTREVAESMGMGAPAGVIVRAVHPGSSAEKAGVREGDVILSVNGNDVSNEQEFRYRIALSQVGQTGEMEILRGGERERLSVEMTAAPETPPRDTRKLSGRHPLAGVTVANLSPALAEEMNIDGTAGGVVVTEAAGSGGLLNFNLALQPGDRILEVNGTKIESTKQLESVLAKEQHNWQIAYARGGNVLTLTVRM